MVLETLRQAIVAGRARVVANTLGISDACLVSLDGISKLGRIEEVLIFDSRIRTLRALKKIKGLTRFMLHHLDPWKRSSW